MCTVSMIMDHYGHEWQRRLNHPRPLMMWQVPQVTPQEIGEFRRLLDRAREYDARHNEPDCELEAKRETLRRLARELGAGDISFLDSSTPEPKQSEAGD